MLIYKELFKNTKIKKMLWRVCFIKLLISCLLFQGLPDIMQWWGINLSWLRKIIYKRVFIQVKILTANSLKGHILHPKIFQNLSRFTNHGVLIQGLKSYCLFENVYPLPKTTSKKFFCTILGKKFWLFDDIWISHIYRCCWKSLLLVLH